MLGAELIKRLGSSSSGGVDLLNATVKTITYEAWVIDSDGFTYRRRYVDHVPVLVNAWITPQVGMSSYEVRATLISGDIPTVGTLSTWQSLASDRDWGWTDGEVHLSKLTIEIRIAGTGSIVDSATVTFVNGEVENPGL